MRAESHNPKTVYTYSIKIPMPFSLKFQLEMLSSQWQQIENCQFFSFICNKSAIQKVIPWKLISSFS